MPVATGATDHENGKKGDSRIAPTGGTGMDSRPVSGYGAPFDGLRVNGTSPGLRQLGV